ncbi:MAG TPA: hypothetical protein VKQ32_24300, partial [Polyangia bacterium]|nr:hypothetical protein [Polyangia bacterium]
GGAAGQGGSGGAAGAGGSGGAAGAAGASGGGGSGGTAGSGGADGGTTCTSSSGCSSTEFCDHSDNRCTSTPAFCQPRPSGCTAVVDPVCGCDGNVYGSPCLANSAGTDISDQGGCTPPQGMFACGPRFCMHGTQYCEAMLGPLPGNPGAYACHPLPAACGTTPTCACLQGTAQCGNCTMSAGGDLSTACLFP